MTLAVRLWTTALSAPERGEYASRGLLKRGGVMMDTPVRADPCCCENYLNWPPTYY